MSSHIQLRIATRIHYGLKQWLGEGIDVGAMLKRAQVEREVLWVCDASNRPELIELARQYRHEARQAMRPMPVVTEGASVKTSVSHTATPSRCTAPQDAAWAQNTSGFGLTELPALFTPHNDQPSGWARATSWLRRAAAR